MLFAITFAPRPNITEEREKRLLKLFGAWTPPAGFEFKGFYDYADGEGGIALVEVASTATMFEALVPWGVFFEFKARPIVPVDISVPLAHKGIAWRDSVS
jgi:hypothetical protein